jgi:transitional endoplasmic reticulum ATPase
VTDRSGYLVNFEGRLAKVLDISEDRCKVVVEVQALTLTGVSDLVRGDVVTITETSLEKAPPGVWVVENSISVVRQIDDDWLLVETALGLEEIANPDVPGLSVGATILWNNVDGYIRTVSDHPIRARDQSADDDQSLAPFIIEKTSTSPTFANFGGYADVVSRARELIRTQLEESAALAAIGAKPIRGVLFTGPPGTGKTLLAQIIAFESGASFYSISGPSIVSKYVGDSEGLLRRIFESASARDSAIIFFDEIDSIAGRRESGSNDSSTRLVAQLLTLMDGASDRKGNVVVVAATNRVNDIDVALRRPGRFDWEIEFGMPTAEDRLEILEKTAGSLAIEGLLPLEAAVSESEGWSAAQITSIWTEAALIAARAGRHAINDEDFAEGFYIIHGRVNGMS